MAEETKRLINYEYKKCHHANAETVILVHGLGLNMTIWDDVVPLLQKKFHVLRYDLPGHGKSDGNVNNMSWEFLLHKFKELLKGLSIAKVHFIGHAAGGNFGIEAALHLKEMIQSLTLVSTPIYFPKELGKRELENRLAKLRNSNMKEITYSIIENLCYPPSNERIAQVQAMYNQVSLVNYTNYTQLIGDKLLSYEPEKIGQVKTPMMILIGEYDVLYPPQLQILNMGYLSNTRFIIIPDAANLIMMDQPDTFMRIYGQFMNKIHNKIPWNIHNYSYTKPLSKELRTIVGILQNDSQHTITIKIVDSFQVIINGQEVDGKWNQRKAKQLLSYLALHKNVTREKLVDTFWPEHHLKKARNHLRVSLNHIKNIIEDHTGESIDNYISINRESIKMNAKVHIDLTELLEELESIRKETHDEISGIINQLRVLPGTIFPSFYDDWIMELRTLVEDRIIHVCEELLDEDLSDEQAIDVLKILIKYNPVEELYYLHLLMLLRRTDKDKELQFFENKWLAQEGEF